MPESDCRPDRSLGSSQKYLPSMSSTTLPRNAGPKPEDRKIFPHKGLSSIRLGASCKHDGILAGTKRQRNVNFPTSHRRQWRYRQSPSHHQQQWKCHRRHPKHCQCRRRHHHHHPRHRRHHRRYHRQHLRRLLPRHRHQHHPCRHPAPKGTGGSRALHPRACIAEETQAHSAWSQAECEPGPQPTAHRAPCRKRLPGRGYQCDQYDL